MIQRILFFTIIIVSLAVTVVGQETSRLVDWPNGYQGSDARVLEIVGITVKGTNVTIGQFFVASDDWLDKLTFRIRNVSDKTITRCGFAVGFPELAPGASGMPGFSIVYDTLKAPGKLPPIPPGSEFELSPRADQLEAIRHSAVQHTGNTRLTRITILPGLATFDDGSGVSGYSLRKH